MDVMPEVVSLDVRARTLDHIVREEITGGARVDHRDTVSAVLARGSSRMLVTVDEGGAIHIDRLERKRPRRRLVFLALDVGATLVMIAVLSQVAILPG
jgi:hypothetical protein